MMNRLEAAARQALARLQAHTDTADLDAIAALNEALAEQKAAEPVDKVAIMQRIVDSQTGHYRPQARELAERAAAPTHQPLTQPEGYKLVPVERSYDMRVQAILHFNTAKKNGADLDDCMDAAWRATLEAAHAITSKEGGAA